jgi:ATP-dependent Clp protease ATP-binding subunit ClpC
MSLDGFGAAASAAMAAAEDEARRSGAGRVGTEHLLLGVLGVDGCSAALALAAVGVSAAPLRRKVAETSLGAGSDAVGGRSPRAERAIGRAHRFAHEARSPEVRSEHLLLGVLDVEGTAGQVLRGLGVDVDRLRARLLVADSPSADETVDVAPPAPAAPSVRCPSCGGDLVGLGVTVSEVPVHHDGGGGAGAASAFACAGCGVLLGIRGISGSGAAGR